MMSLNLRSFHLAQRLKERIKILRSTLERSSETVATDVEIVLMQAPRDDNVVRSDGDVVVRSQWHGFLLTPNPDIQAGDIVLREDGERFFIHEIWQVAQVMQLFLVARPK